MNTEFMNEWFDDQVDISSASMAEFDKYVEQYLAVRAEADELDAQLTEKNKIMKAMSEKLIAYLDEQGKESHVTPKGTITSVSRETWKAPEGAEREKVIEYLKEHDAFDAVMAFNANKFHAWYNSERENNPGFDLPGVTQNAIRYIQFRRKKG